MPVSHNNMSSYQYDALPDEKCIRTVIIHPGGPQEDMVVSLECIHFDGHHPPVYEALSYVWGSNENPEHVQVTDKANDKSRLPVTHNLAVALRHLRLVDRSRVMWIDAICINQQDNVEKGPQVAKMSDIYSKASRVVVWLGPEQGNSNAAMDFLGDVGSQIEVNWHDDAMTSLPGARDPTLSDREVPLPTDGNEIWEAIFGLLSRSWFDRLWIRQEIYLAVSAAVLCGEREVPWPAFRGALYCITFKTRTIWVNRPGGEKLHFALADRLRSLMAMHDQSPIVVEDMRDRFDEVQCFDARDRIFALRAMVARGQQAFWPAPDYTRPAVEIYEELVLAFLSKFRYKLNILEQCELHDRPSALGTSPETRRRPSWIPDWSVGISIPRKWQGGGCRLGDWHEVPGPGVLRVLGRRQDVIRTVDAIHSWTECRGVAQHEAAEVYRRLLPAVKPGDVYPPGGRLVTAYAHALINGHIAERRYNNTGGWPLSEEISGFVERLVSGRPLLPDEISDGRPMARAMNALANYPNKQLFTGEGGYVGMAPPPVRAGDEVWAVVGCAVPVVLRRVDEDQYVVVSACYAAGLADGEGLLGPLPQGVRGSWAPDRKGNWRKGFQDVETGRTFFKDPRMESLGLFRGRPAEQLDDPSIAYLYEPEKLMEVIPGLQKIDLV